MKVARKPNERVDRKLAGRFIETVLRLFLVTFVVAAVVSPADPLPFVAIVIGGWILSLPVAYWLVYRGGGTTLARSGLYDPGALADRRLVLWFAATAIIAKLLLLALAAVASTPPGPLGGALLGLLALGVAYGMVYRRGYDRLGVR